MKSGKYFHFKQFTIAQDRCAHKVGTDGVLLGAWVKCDKATSILDIGTGTGLIALMLAQRTEPNIQIDGIELGQEEAAQANENVFQSPWKEKVKIHHVAIQHFFPEKYYDLIVSNPPYFVNSQLPPGQKRQDARHTQSLPFHDLLQAVIGLMNHDGKFSVILPYSEGLDFMDLAKTYGLLCSKQWSFKSRSHKSVERLLLEFSLEYAECTHGSLVLYDQVNHNEWSAAYQLMIKEFYLKI